MPKKRIITLTKKFQIYCQRWLKVCKSDQNQQVVVSDAGAALGLKLRHVA